MYHLNSQERIKEKETGVLGEGVGGGEEERERKRQVGRREEKRRRQKKD